MNVKQMLPLVRRPFRTETFYLRRGGHLGHSVDSHGQGTNGHNELDETALYRGVKCLQLLIITTPMSGCLRCLAVLVDSHEQGTTVTTSSMKQLSTVE